MLGDDDDHGDGDHFPVNIAKAVEAAMTSLTVVGRAYAALQLYAEHVLPPTLKKAMARAGKVRDWSALLPPFDAVARRSAAALLVYKQHHFRRRPDLDRHLPPSTARDGAVAHAGSGGLVVRQPFSNARTYVQHSVAKRPLNGADDAMKPRKRFKQA